MGREQSGGSHVWIPTQYSPPQTFCNVSLVTGHLGVRQQVMPYPAHPQVVVCLFRQTLEEWGDSAVEHGRGRACCHALVCPLCPLPPPIHPPPKTNSKKRSDGCNECRNIIHGNLAPASSWDHPSSSQLALTHCAIQTMAWHKQAAGALQKCLCCEHA